MIPPMIPSIGLAFNIIEIIWISSEESRRHSLLVGTSRENVRWTPYFAYKIILFQLDWNSFIIFLLFSYQNKVLQSFQKSAVRLQLLQNKSLWFPILKQFKIFKLRFLSSLTIAEINGYNLRFLNIGIRTSC